MSVSATAALLKTSLNLQHLFPQARTRTGTRDITATGTRDMGTKAMVVTVASRDMAVTVAMAATTIPLHTMDMVVVMTTVSLHLPDAFMIVLWCPFHVHSVTCCFSQPRAARATEKHRDAEATRVATSHTDHMQNR